MYSGYTLSYGLDYGGKAEVLEGYGELDVPVFCDSPVGDYLEVDGAVRWTHNKNTGTLGANDGQSNSRDFVTWKLSGIWDLTDWVRLRATRSRHVRAPQFRELFQTYATTVGGPFGSVSNPWPGGGPSDPVNIDSGGDVDLRPEEADTLTAGVVLRLRRCCPASASPPTGTRSRSTKRSSARRSASARKTSSPTASRATKPSAT